MGPWRAIICCGFLFALLQNVCRLFHMGFAGDSNFICYFICCCVFPSFSVGFCGQFLPSDALCFAVNDLPFLWAFRAIISFGLLFALLLNYLKRQPAFIWALRVVLISYVAFFSVSILPHFIGYAGYNLVVIGFAGHFILAFCPCGLFCF